MTKTQKMFLAMALCTFVSPAFADCTLDAKAAISGMVKAPPFHIAIKTVSNGLESRMVGEVVMPDSFRLAFGNSAMIMTPRGAWMFENKKWKPQPEEAASVIKHTLLSGFTDGLTGMRNVKCNPKAKLNGKTYKMIAFDKYNKPGDKTPLAHIVYYLNKKDLPVWIITNGQTSKGNSAVVQQFTYDPSINITDPK